MERNTQVNADHNARESRYRHRRRSRSTSHPRVQLPDNPTTTSTYGRAQRRKLGYFDMFSINNISTSSKQQKHGQCRKGCRRLMSFLAKKNSAFKALISNKRRRTNVCGIILTSDDTLLPSAFVVDICCEERASECDHVCADVCINVGARVDVYAYMCISNALERDSERVRVLRVHMLCICYDKL